MDEKKMLELLRSSADSITPPDALQPDSVEAMLSRRQSEPDASEKTDSREPKRRTGWFRTAARLGSLAAIFALGLTVLWQSEQITNLKTAGAPNTPQENLLAGFTESEAMTDSASDTEGTLADTDSAPETEGTLKDTDSASDTEDTLADTDSAPETGGTLADADSASDTEGTLVNAAAAPEAALADTTSYEDIYDAFRYAETYQELYDTLHSLFSFFKNEPVYDYGLEMAEMEIENDAIAYSSGTSMDARTSSLSYDEGAQTQDSVSYSKTNLQEAGVDEGDLVKTDGNYLYILKQDLSFVIVKASPDSLEVVSTTKLDVSGLSYAQIRELYLDGDTLNIVADGQQTLLEEEKNLYYSSTQAMTVLYTWDISDRKNPVLSGTINQEGRYESSRKTGNFLYLFTVYYPTVADTYEESTLVPRINGEAIPAGSFFLPDHLNEQNYLVISSIDTQNPSRILDEKVLVSGADDFYVSEENIYVTNENYQNGNLLTEIVRFRYADGMISGEAAGSVSGYLNNSFSMNEYRGYLRVVSTSYGKNGEETNALYVLDKNLHVLSSIEDLGKGETIRSARFFGDAGYFVTFRQTDPLFSVDLSDPEHPVILGELKVSGFSSYLHFYGENQLLGIGYEADEATGAVSGLKLSMFDISDPSDVKEISRTVIPGITWCPAIEDYKSILVDSKKNLIGFYCDSRYLIYSYQPESGFVRELIYDFYSDDLASEAEYNTMRGVYIGDTLYLAGNSFVIPFDIPSGFTKQEPLRF